MAGLCLNEAFKYIGHKAKNSYWSTNTPLCTTNPDKIQNPLLARISGFETRKIRKNDEK